MFNKFIDKYSYLKRRTPLTETTFSEKFKEVLNKEKPSFIFQKEEGNFLFEARLSITNKGEKIEEQKFLNRNNNKTKNFFFLLH